MIDVTGLLVAVDRLADQVRALPHSRLQRGVASEVLALARELSRRAQRRECPEAEPRRMPDAGPFVVADQLAVAGRDLAVAHSVFPRRPESGAAEAPAVGGPGVEEPEAAVSEAAVPGIEGRDGMALEAEIALVEATARRCGLR